MHPLMARVLELRQLNSASQLFALSDYDVITDLSTAFQGVKRIFNEPSYPLNRLDQNVVEIVIARITAAIRETSSIETYCAELVDVLDSCLKHNMITVVDEKGTFGDSPHCKIANDLLSCLFLNYNKRSVMTLALPVAIKALGCGNQDLVKNISNYISLASIHNGKSLAHFAIQLIQHIINGNLTLLRVLPQIYNENREPFHAHLTPLLEVLENKDADCSDKLSLLQLASMIANFKPDLLAPFLSMFDSFLRSPSTCAAVLNIYMSMISQGKAHHLAPYLQSLKEISSKAAFASNRVTVSKIIGNIGRVSPQIASNAMEELMRSAKDADAQLQPSILNEIEGIAACYPQCIRPYVDSLRALSSPSNSRIIERINNLAGVSSRASHSGSHVIPPEPTTIYVQGPGPSSSDSLSRSSIPRTSQQALPNVVTSGSRTVFAISDPVESSTQELDRNTHSLAMRYQNTSSGSLSRMNSKSHASMNGPRSISENVSVSRELSQSSIPASLVGSARVPPDYRPPPQYQQPTAPKSSTLPATFDTSRIQMGRDGRVRPVAGQRRPVKWPVGSYETTFPANSDPVTTTKMHPLNEEDENQWNGAVDRSDVVLQFVDHRRNKIRRYVSEISSRFPIPIQCTVEGSKSSKHRMIVYFACQSRVSSYCVFNEEYLFEVKTKMAESWLHLMFLQMQYTALENGGFPVGQSSNSYQTLAQCWQCLPQSVHKDKPFVTLVTSAFPSSKDQEKLLKELEEVNFFDCFNLDPMTNHWNCFSCAFPDKVRCFIEEGGVHKMLEGHLKEKKGRWRFLRRWHTKYFTLSSAALTCSRQQVSNIATNGTLPAIDLKSIRSVRSLGRGKKNRKSLRRAFEIFTSDNSSVVLKATDEKQAEEWLHCIQIAVACAKRDS